MWAPLEERQAKLRETSSDDTEQARLVTDGGTDRLTDEEAAIALESLTRDHAVRATHPGEPDRWILPTRDGDYRWLDLENDREHTLDPAHTHKTLTCYADAECIGLEDAPDAVREAADRRLVTDGGVDRSRWSPQNGSKRRCQNCNGQVTKQFARVFGDNRDIVHGCPKCITGREMHRGEAADE